ncbi:hypothetical protein GCK32_006955 [Trichostrongylus colubriformis]|uniref:Uncharacterized protein n=1 Tax=Trichostrongylus colubriformis TaxID=6319 RepID=A0AAN8FKI7_TRICO
MVFKGSQQCWTLSIFTRVTVVSINIKEKRHNNSFDSTESLIIITASPMHYSLLLLVVSCAFGYVFDCLDKCECDTDDEVVHCHNGERTKLTLPEGQRLRGFPVIGMTYNNIVNLPDEKLLLNKFPDLKDTLRQLQEFFIMVANRVNQVGTNIQETIKEKMKDSGEKSTADTASDLTPMPELKEVELN